MNGVGGQGFARPCFSEKDDGHIRLRGQGGEPQATLHGVVRRRQVFNFEAGKSALHDELVAHIFAQLTDGFESIFDHRAPPHDDPCLAAHPNAQREVMAFG